MDCDQAKLKMNALVDGEVDEEDVPALISHMESCYKCREEYIELLRLQKKMKGLKIPEPSKEWFEKFSHRSMRKASGVIGKIFFIVSYILLLGYSLYTFFTSSDADVFIKITLGGVLLGFIVLFGVTISDRIKESKTDRYKGVQK